MAFDGDSPALSSLFMIFFVTVPHNTQPQALDNLPGDDPDNDKLRLLQIGPQQGSRLRETHERKSPPTSPRP